MLNKDAVESLQKQINELERIRDQLLPSPTPHLTPIFKKLDELYAQLLKELGHSTSNS